MQHRPWRVDLRLEIASLDSILDAVERQLGSQETKDFLLKVRWYVRLKVQQVQI